MNAELRGSFAVLDCEQTGLTLAEVRSNIESLDQELDRCRFELAQTEKRKSALLRLEVALRETLDSSDRDSAKADAAKRLGPFMPKNSKRGTPRLDTAGIILSTMEQVGHPLTRLELVDTVADRFGDSLDAFWRDVEDTVSIGVRRLVVKNLVVKGPDGRYALPTPEGSVT